MLLACVLTPSAGAQDMTTDEPARHLLEGESDTDPDVTDDPELDRMSYPNFTGEWITRLGLNSDYKVEGPLEEITDEFIDIIATPRLEFTDRFKIDSEIRLETTSLPTENRRFEDEGIFVRKLWFQYDPTDDLSLLAGKITPRFAIASLVTPGMFGNNYNKEIELIERIGFEAQYTFDAGSAGMHTLSGSTFFDDTSVLSESLGNNRGQTSLSDGGASNTESFESFTLALSGQEITSLPGFRYQVGLIHEAAGRGDADDENGFVVAADWTRRFTEDTSLMAIAEVAPIWNFEGSADDVLYTSAGLVLRSGRWLGVVSGTYRLRDLSGGGEWNDYSLQTTVEYEMGYGFSVAVAHEFLRDQNFDGRRVGVRLNYSLAF